MRNSSTSKCVLTIAGTDPSGAAGIQVDLQVFRDFGCHGLSVVTAVLAQNTQGVQGLHIIEREMLVEQLRAVLQDCEVAAIKIGLLPSVASVEAVAEVLDQYLESETPIVLDPVLRSGDGAFEMVQVGTLDAIRDHLLPRVDVLTPNILEAQKLSGISIENQRDLMDTAIALQELGPKAVLVKAGHMNPSKPSLLTHGEIDRQKLGQDNVLTIADAWADASTVKLMPALAAIDEDVRGTGCQLASAICGGLAKGDTPLDSATHARNYLNNLLHHQRKRIGKGRSIIVRNPASYLI